MNANPRRSRNICYNLFYSFLANKYFYEIAELDKTHKEREQFYCFYVQPGGRWGANDPRIVEVFYGSRPYESYTVNERNISGYPQKTIKNPAETGASIVYKRGPAGHCLVQLFPPETEDLKQLESFVILEFRLDPRLLTGNNTLKKHWKAFSSYQETKSLDGTPTLMDRMRTWWILFSKPLCINEAIHQPKYKTFLAAIVKWVFIVGGSGFLLKLIDFFFPMC